MFVFPFKNGAVTHLITNLTLNYITSFFAFITMLICARILGASEYAWVLEGIAIAGFAMPLLNLGNESIFVRDAIQLNNPHSVGQMANSSLNLRISLTIVFVFVLIFSSLARTSTITDAASMFTFSLWGSLLGLHCASWYDYLGETKTQNVLVFFERAVSLLLMILILFAPSGWHHAFIVGIILLLVRIFFIVKQVKVGWALFDAGNFKWSFRFRASSLGGTNLTVALTLVLNSLATYGNQLILAHSEERQVFASYGLLFQIMSVIFIFQNLGIRFVKREIAEACFTRKRILFSLGKNAFLITAGSSILALAIWAAVPYLPLLLSDSKFASMSIYSVSLGSWVVIAGIGQVVTQFNVCLKRETVSMWSAATGGTVAILLGLIFIPIFGGYAAAIILIIATTLTLLIEASSVISVVIYGGKNSALV